MSENEWLFNLAKEMVKYNFFEIRSAYGILNEDKLDYDAWLEYYELGYTPEEAILEDLENA